MFKDKPIRNLERGVWTSTYMYCVIDKELFPELSWNDNPIEVFLYTKESLEKEIIKSRTIIEDSLETTIHNAINWS